MRREGIKDVSVLAFIIIKVTRVGLAMNWDAVGEWGGGDPIRYLPESKHECTYLIVAPLRASGGGRAG